MSVESEKQEVILFNVGTILCGLPIDSVLEIKKINDITKVFGAPEVVKGVINLRGQIVTVLDMRLRFGFDADPLSGKERIIVVPYGDEHIGLLVNSVDDVIQLEEQLILPVPQNMDENFSVFFSGVYQYTSEIISLVSLAVVCNTEAIETTVSREV